MLVKYNKCNAPVYKDDFFNDFVSRRYYGSGYGSSPAVNIIEEADAFIIDVAAAGLSKDDFKIELADDVLTISSDKKEDKKSESNNYTRREFYYGSFTRSFRMNDSIDREAIRAEHIDGILRIHLPKLEEAKKTGPRSIDIK